MSASFCIYGVYSEDSIQLVAIAYVKQSTTCIYVCVLLLSELVRRPLKLGMTCFINITTGYFTKVNIQQCLQFRKEINIDLLT